MNATGALLAQTLGWSDWVLDGVVLPALVVAVLFGLRALLHRFVPHKAATEETQKRWRRATLYLTLIAAISLAGTVLRLRLGNLAQAFAPAVGRSVSEIVVLARGFGRAVFATLILLVLLHAMRQAFRLILRLVDRWVDRMGGVHARKALLQPKQIHETLVMVVRVARAISVIALFYLYIPIMLSSFEATRPYAEKLKPFVVEPLLKVVSAIVDYLPELAALVLIAFVARSVLRFLRLAMNALGRGALVLKGFDPEWATPTFKLVRIVIILVTIVIAYPFLPGAGTEIFKGFSLFLGALLTLGGTSTVANVLCGIVLTYSGAFRIGDRVQVGDTFGDVVEKTLFVTRIRTLTNEHVTLPNSIVFGGRVINYSASAAGGGLAVTVEAGIGYDVDWRKVHELMKAAAAKTAHVVKEPEPIVLQMELGDYAVKYLLVAQVDEPKLARVVGSDIRQHMLDLFAEAQIEIMTPTVNALRNASDATYPQAQQQADPVQSALRFITHGPKGSAG